MEKFHTLGEHFGGARPVPIPPDAQKEGRPRFLGASLFRLRSGGRGDEVRAEQDFITEIFLRKLDLGSFFLDVEQLILKIV